MAEEECSIPAELTQYPEQPTGQSGIVSAASAELPVSTMASSTPADPQTSSVISAEVNNIEAAPTATALPVAPEVSSSGAETATLLQEETGPKPGNRIAESASQQDASDAQTPTELLEECPEDVGEATPADPDVLLEPSQPLPPEDSASDSDTEDPLAEARPGALASDSLSSDHAAPAVQAAVASELLPPPVLEAYTGSNLVGICHALQAISAIIRFCP